MSPEERIQAVAEAFVNASETIIARQYGLYSFDDLTSEAKTRFKAGAIAAIAAADATRPVTDAMRQALRKAMENEPYASYDFTWCSDSERDEIITRLCEAALKVTE